MTDLADVQPPAPDPLYTEAVKKILEAEQHRDLPLLYDFLAWKYEPFQGQGGGRLLSRLGQTYPTMVYKAAPSQQKKGHVTGLNGPLGRAPENVLNGPRDTSYRELLVDAKRLTPPDLNRPTYAMSQLTVSRGPSLTCWPSDYFAGLDTSDVLEWELLSNAHKLNGNDVKSFEEFDKELPLRRELHQLVPNPLISGDFRSASVGLSTLIVYRSDPRDRIESYNLLVKRRSSSSVAAHAKGIHVIPSHMFQPAGAEFISQDYDAGRCFRREYLEELFNIPEPEEDVVDPEYFERYELLRPLDSILASGEAQVYFTGIAVNLLTMRPEICGLLLIHNTNWYLTHSEATGSMPFKVNIEWTLTEVERRDPSLLSVGHIGLSDRDERMAQDALGRERMVPTGAASFWMGVDLARKELRPIIRR